MPIGEANIYLPPPPPEGYIRFVIWQDHFHRRLVLLLPISFISGVTKKPIRWLQHVASAILSTSGSITILPDTNPSMPLDGELQSGGRYYFISGASDL